MSEKKHMQRIILLVFLAALLFESCSKTSSTTVITSHQTNISGIWYVVNDTLITRNGSVSTEYDGTATGYVFDGSYYMQYNTDGSGISDNGGEMSKFNYTIKNNLLTVNSPAQTVVDDEGNTVNLDASVKSDTIRNLTATTMVLYNDDKFTGGENIETTYFSTTKP